MSAESWQIRQQEELELAGPASAGSLATWLAVEHGSSGFDSIAVWLAVEQHGTSGCEPTGFSLGEDYFIEIIISTFQKNKRKY